MNAKEYEEHEEELSGEWLVETRKSLFADCDKLELLNSVSAIPRAIVSVPCPWLEHRERIADLVSVPHRLHSRIDHHKQ